VGVTTGAGGKRRRSQAKSNSFFLVLPVAVARGEDAPPLFLQFQKASR
jgi:hypothetical protein